MDDFYSKARESYAGQRFALQREAFKAGDMAAVKAFADEAHEEIATKEAQTASITWEKAKEILDTMPEPSEQETAYVKGTNGGSHEADRFGKKQHSLIGFKHDFKIGKYEARFNWSVCPDCKKVWSKSLVVFNNEENVCYEKEIIKKGKFVEEGDNG